MISDKLKKLLKDNPKVLNQLNQISKKFSERAMRLGQGEPILTRETIHLMAVEMQLVLRNSGFNVRIIIEKKGDNASITLTSLEDPRRLFVSKEQKEKS